MIKECSPSFLEKLVVDLLLAMGYGGSKIDAGQAYGRNGDGGIDGIIKEDKLGSDTSKKVEQYGLKTRYTSLCREPRRSPGKKKCVYYNI
jgi:restriction endonuclease Mrr